VAVWLASRGVNYANVSGPARGLELGGAKCKALWFFATQRCADSAQRPPLCWPDSAPLYSSKLRSPLRSLLSLAVQRSRYQLAQLPTEASCQLYVFFFRPSRIARAR